MRVTTGLVLAALLGAGGPALAQDAKGPPYFASISAGKARMRTGPGRTYPASWLFQRADLPVRVVRVLKEWRQVQDPDGATGWMQANLLSGRRTVIVRGTQPVAMLARPASGARLLWRAAPGVVGRVSQCADGWCFLDVKGQGGFVRLGNQLWGVEAGETLP